MIIMGILLLAGTILCAIITAASLMRCRACGAWHESAEEDLKCARENGHQKYD